MGIDTNGPQFGEVERKKFEDGVLEIIWTDSGIPYFIIKSGLDLSEYAHLAKLSLEHYRQIAHDFTSKVTDESGEQEVEFTYCSKWFLEGLSNEDV
ncbi:hypothetical protein FFJ24_009955 [Pedobacter sp. KBS0701]|uniref:hypothetical protein n=1 Tax=Pedobacter sp. KBS0701 TaxID=2578106 RepID=UPI00110EE9EA|nr:hypothetical protein [Pedobacter sp. KBS0701]QDW25115.1 hypothetical protein FFJ24_009955 [Pedobacter sp. KBS0701]